MIWLLLGAQVRCTVCCVGVGLGDGLVEDTPSPLKLRVAGEERLGLSRETVAAAAPTTVGLNHTWKITFWLGAREKPGERLEYPKPEPATVMPCKVRLILPVF